MKENVIVILDGMEHETYENCWCSPVDRKCKKCNSNKVHYQPVYGGYFYWCEACKAEFI